MSLQHKENIVMEGSKLDYDQESGIEDVKERTMYNSIQETNPKDILLNTDAPSRPVNIDYFLWLYFTDMCVVLPQNRYSASLKFSSWLTSQLVWSMAILVRAYTLRYYITTQRWIIGTSPLYTFSGTFTSTPDREDILGALSIIIWSLTLVVCVKYCGFVLSADDNGEGGTFALYSLLSRYVSVLMHVCIWLVSYVIIILGQYLLEQSQRCEQNWLQPLPNWWYQEYQSQCAYMDWKLQVYASFDQLASYRWRVHGNCWWYSDTSSNRYASLYHF